MKYISYDENKTLIFQRNKEYESDLNTENTKQICRNLFRDKELDDVH